MVQHCYILCWDHFQLGLQPCDVFIFLRKVGEFFVYLGKVLGGSAALKSLIFGKYSLWSQLYCAVSQVSVFFSSTSRELV